MHVGVVRNAKGLKVALAKLAAIEAEAGGDPLVVNMVLTARLIATAALKRKESRGGHYRSDYPASAASLAKRTFIKIADLSPPAPRVRRKAAHPEAASCSP